MQPLPFALSMRPSAPTCQPARLPATRAAHRPWINAIQRASFLHILTLNVSMQGGTTVRPRNISAAATSASRLLRLACHPLTHSLAHLLAQAWMHERDAQRTTHTHTHTRARTHTHIPPAHIQGLGPADGCRQPFVFDAAGSRGAVNVTSLVRKAPKPELSPPEACYCMNSGAEEQCGM